MTIERKYWNEKMETLPLAEMRAFQLAKLQETAAWVYERVPFYRRKFDEKGVKPADIRSLEDLARLPLTAKADLRDNYPFGLAAAPLEEVAQIHASSGTTGNPITAVHTAQDVDDWAECMARNLWSAGIRPRDVVQVGYGYGLFTGGLGLHQGARKLGCAVLPTSVGLTERQVKLMRDLGSTALCCTPSYALTIAEKAQEMGVDVRALPLRVGVFGAEPWTREIRREIEERMGIVAHEVYGLTEMMGPGVAFSCEGEAYQRGAIHVNEDHLLAEIIDPVTEEPLPLGAKGELVFTSLQRRAMPLIRYRTRDISRLTREGCSCGRSLVVMDKVLGRSDDMLIISGVNVFPSQIESILMEVRGVEPQYVIVVKKKGYLDTLHIDVEAGPGIYEQGQATLDGLAKKVSARVKAVIGITVTARIVPPKTIVRSEGKAKRVFDARNK